MDGAVDNTDFTYADKQYILCAASCLVAFNNGYNRAFSISSILDWKAKISHQITSGVPCQDVGENNYTFRIANTNVIEKDYPRYLYNLFRDTPSNKRHNAGFRELTDQMNISSTLAKDLRPHIFISAWQLLRTRCKYQ